MQPNTKLRSKVANKIRTGVRSGASEVMNNPLFSSSGSSGVNPLHR